MAYGNWGAYVYKNGERIESHEDVLPYREEEGISGWPIVLLVRTEQQMCHHATLGKERIRWCAHKAYPILYIDGKAMDEQELRKRYATNTSVDPDDGYIWEGDDTVYQGEVDGYKFRAQPFDGNMIDLELIEPDGTVWQARSGYAYGAGWEKDSEGNTAYSAHPWTR